MNSLKADSIKGRIVYFDGTESPLVYGRYADGAERVPAYIELDGVRYVSVHSKMQACLERTEALEQLVSGLQVRPCLGSGLCKYNGCRWWDADAHCLIEKQIEDLGLEMSNPPWKRNTSARARRGEA